MGVQHVYILDFRCVCSQTYINRGNSLVHESGCVSDVRMRPIGSSISGGHVTSDDQPPVRAPHTPGSYTGNKITCTQIEIDFYGFTYFQLCGLNNYRGAFYFYTAASQVDPVGLPQIADVPQTLINGHSVPSNAQPLLNQPGPGRPSATGTLFTLLSARNVHIASLGSGRGFIYRRLQV